jgi:SAM-dependent methyltransferase
MHPLNKVLYRVGVMLQWTRDSVLIPRSFHLSYRRQLEALRRHPRGFDVHAEERFDVGVHPHSFIDEECAFASRHVLRTRPERILDVGSYRHFILGLLAHTRVTTIDVRSRSAVSENEDVVTCDAKQLTLPDGAFPLVVSLCTLEHFGLGRYGDALDLDADGKAFAEMKRVVAPGGRLVISTTVSRRAQIVFNAHRIYSLPMLRRFCDGLECEEELFYSHAHRRFCGAEEISDRPEVWDVYLGCWRKPI